MRNLLISLVFIALLFSCQKRSSEPIVVVTILGDSTRQTIENFGASDCWTVQNIGLWNDSTRNFAAKTLFSKEFDSDGNPLGIGLSLWRFNIGAGSASQGDASNIPDKYRRVECFLDEKGNYNFNKQAGQVWFLKKAKEYGVEQYVAYVNSPPIYMTKNKKANCSTKNESNLDEAKYPAFTDFISNVLIGLHATTGVDFNYISPIVGPQWAWMGGQEGMHLDNNSFAKIIRSLDKSLQTKSLKTKILIPEAGSFNYLINNKESGCGQQIDEFWGMGENSIANLSTVASIVTAHGYFTNWPLKLMLEKRDSVNSHLRKYPQLRFWQTEYCILGGNEGIASIPRDTTINLGLYVARLVHLDVVKGNVSAWHWWLAASMYNYNDGLLVADDVNKTIKDTKLTWALGNFSRFVRPGAVRIETILDNNQSLDSQTEGLMVSAYKDLNKKKITIVAINMSKKEIPLKFKLKDIDVKKLSAFETSARNNLRKMETLSSNEEYIVPARSITTFYGDIKY
jgi:O-glycosyl hydrolase